METKKLKRYLSSQNWGLIILGSIFLIVGIGSLVILLPESDSVFKTLLTSLFVTGLGVLILWVSVSSIRELNAQLQAMEASGELARVLEDFAQGEVLVKGNVRLGKYYVFGKGSDRVIRYEEIRRVYQYIKKRNFVETTRCLKYVDPQGTTRDLCPLLLRGKSDEEALRIMNVIHSKNPTTQFGYTK